MSRLVFPLCNLIFVNKPSREFLFAKVQLLTHERLKQSFQGDYRTFLLLFLAEIFESLIHGL